MGISGSWGYSRQGDAGSSRTTQIKPAVMGTWNVPYPVKEFDRVRTDGVSIIDLVPECRVFIFGSEVTKDINSVSINFSVESGATCNIELSNPRGRYEISKYDLMKKWREDKDFLAAYSYPIFNRIDPTEFTNIVTQVGGLIAGPGGAAQTGEALKYTKSLFSLFDYAPKIKTSTRMIFEVKNFSGFTKRAGDVVFDFRDPVYVFFKGRFSPYWYFAFSGIVTGWDDEDTYGSGQTIRLKCSDTSEIWKRTKFTTKGAFFAGSRFETSQLNTSANIATNYWSNLAGAFNISDLIKVIANSYDYGSFTKNCHITNLEPDQALQDVSIDEGIYQQLRAEMHRDGWIAEDFMTTLGQGSRTPAFTLGGSGKSKYGQINISDIHYAFFAGKLNTLNFSPYTPIYTQFNEIEFPQFTASNLKPFFDLSVRYWEAEHTIRPKFAAGDPGNGWEDTKAFGVCGIHPAMKYEFVNNFNTLEGIWRECYFVKSSQIEKLVLTPADKIRESIIGSPMEMPLAGGAVATVGATKGSHRNLFRPRLFLILPQKFAMKERKAGSTDFASFGSLFGPEEQTSIYEYLKEKIRDLEYVCYTSPMGDIFLEPEMYDFHPLDYCPKIEVRDIVKKSEDVTYRASSSEYTTRDVARTDKAYMFNSDANHPFFIMEKDRMRCTQTFDHRMVYTSVKVSGAQSGVGGIFNILRSETQNVVTAIGGADAQNDVGDNPFVQGWYIADGFERLRIYMRTAQRAQQRNLEKLRAAYRRIRKVILIDLVRLSAEKTIHQVAIDSVSAILELKYDPTFNMRCKNSPSLQYIRNFYEIVSQEYGDDIPSAEELAPILYTRVLDALAEDGNKSVQEIISYTRTSSLTDEQNAQNENFVTSLMGARSQSIADALNEVDTFDVEGNSFHGLDNATMNALIDLNYPNALQTNDLVQTLQDDLDTTVADMAGNPNDRAAYFATHPVVSIQDIKELERLGLYNPRLDMVLRYGVNPLPEMTRPYVRNGSEVVRFAKIIFNRFYGKAHKISMDIVGRPELFLNRTYYCEKKDSVGWLSNYSITYNYGSSFSSSLTLEYVRKNSLVYNYSLGNIDDVVGRHDNKYFSKEADRYFLWNKIIQQSAPLAGAGVSNLIGGKNLAGAVAGEVVGNLTSSLISGMSPVGGLYSSHDQLGHLNFDDRGNQENIEDLPLARANSLGIISGLRSVLVTTSRNITSNLDNYTLVKTEYDGFFADYTIKRGERQILSFELERISNMSTTAMTPAQSRAHLYQITELTTEVQNMDAEINMLAASMIERMNSAAASLDALYGLGYSAPQLQSHVFPAHPDNVDTYVKDKFSAFMSSISSTTLEVETGTRITPAIMTRNPKLKSLGWFVELLKQHLFVFPTAYNATTGILNVTISKTSVPLDGTTDSSVKYYIRNNSTG